MMTNCPLHHSVDDDDDDDDEKKNNSEIMSLCEEKSIHHNPDID